MESKQANLSTATVASATTANLTKGEIYRLDSNFMLMKEIRNHLIKNLSFYPSLYCKFIKNFKPFKHWF